MTPERLTARVLAVLRDRTDHVLVDERQASERLGYTRRTDHPWSPVNRTRRLVSEPEAARGEHAEFEGVDFTS